MASSALGRPGGGFPEQMSSPASHDPADLLAHWWATYTAVDEDDEMLDVKRRLAVTAPFGQVWPGLAASRETVTNPEQLASDFAQAFITDCPRTRLGLVRPIRCRGADSRGLGLAPATTKTTLRNSLRSSAIGKTDSEPVSLRSGFPRCTSASPRHR